jgi:hypothetical protein
VQLSAWPHALFQIPERGDARKPHQDSPLAPCARCSVGDTQLDAPIDRLEGLDRLLAEVLAMFGFIVKSTGRPLRS